MEYDPATDLVVGPGKKTEDIFKWIRRHPRIRQVILTGRGKELYEITMMLYKSKDTLERISFLSCSLVQDSCPEYCVLICDFIKSCSKLKTITLTGCGRVCNALFTVISTKKAPDGTFVEYIGPMTDEQIEFMFRFRNPEKVAPQEARRSGA